MFQVKTMPSMFKFYTLNDSSEVPQPQDGYLHMQSRRVDMAINLCGLMFLAFISFLLLRAKKFKPLQTHPISHPRNSPISPPCEQVIEEAERTNIRNGHGNAGYLSKVGGFSCLKPTLSLPASHAAWDELATDLPRLAQTQTTRETIRKMPLLDASVESLPDQYLLRASTILGTAAHVFVRMEGGEPLTKRYESHSDILPPALAIPWTTVCKRLGRSVASLTYVDGVSTNYTSTSASYSGVALKNLNLLVPALNTIEEHVFFGTMIETEAKTIPIMHHMIEAQRAVLAQDRSSLKHAIQILIPLLKAVTKTLAKLHTNPSSKNHIDPVLWTLTVANLGIPWVKEAVGVAGTSHPFYHMMDEFSGRFRYETVIGKEAQSLRALHPLHWRQFFKALAEVSVTDYVAASNDQELMDLWETLTSSYHGKDGLLAFHRRKVFGFLSVSFRIGRTTTINGLGLKHNTKPWHETDEVLEEGRQERDGLSSEEPESVIEPIRNKVFVSQLIEQNSEAAGYWFAAQGSVYDASSFMQKHPGGDTIIALCSGRDITDDLKAVGHFSIPSIRSKLETFRIATLSKPNFSSSQFEELYLAAVDLGQRIAELENIHHRNFQILNGKFTGLDESETLTPMKSPHLRDAKARLQNDQVPALARLLDSLLDNIGEINVDLDMSSIRTEIMRILAPEAGVSPVDAYQSYDMAVQTLQDDSSRLLKIKMHVGTVLRYLESSDFQKISDLLSPLGRAASEMVALAGK